jgi:lysylphosphatidylglycerol synthetase-like protein (DUF2156 family)
MTTAFVALATGCLALAIGLFLDGPKSWLARIGAILLLFTSAGLITSAIFPTDLETVPSTPTGDIHTVSFLVNVVSISVSAIMLTVSYGGSERWRRRQRPALIFTALLIIAFAAQYFTLRRGAPYGITNRLFVAVLMSWLLSNAFWLRQATTSPRRFAISNFDDRPA